MPSIAAHDEVLNGTPTTSDRQGGYVLTAPAAGRYTIAVDPATLAPVAETVVLAPEAPTEHGLVITNHATLAGSVLSASTGHTLPEALVTLSNGDGDIVTTATTDRQGRLRFTELPAAASYTLTATGYPPVTAAADLTAGAEAHITLHLGGPGAGTTAPDAATSDPNTPATDVDLDRRDSA